MYIPNEKCYRALYFDDEAEYAEYIGALTDRINSDGADFVSLNNRGVARFELGEVSGALDDLMAACRLAANDATPFLNRADVLQKKGDLREALEAATEAIRIEPATCSGYLTRAGIYEKLGDLVRAREDTQTGERYKVA
ncbi:MAG TPA: hypothetical protein VG796_09370 [Verrucomicrobiales bacterium]|jgi:tetratricopeptide (TPR) repeat protein|nr:hypothetical protein [Verrucomicrobiales bacterium]